MKNDYQSFNRPADQGFINKVLLKKENKLLNIKKLPKDNYLVGDRWYRNHKYISEKAILVHYNYVIGDFRKIFKMIRHLDYFSYDFHYVILSYLRVLISKVKLKIKK